MRKLTPFLLIPLFAAASAAPKPVIWGVAKRTVPVAPGSVAQVTIYAGIQPGWHVYSLTQKPGGPVPLRIQVGRAPDLSLAARIEGPLPKMEFDRNFGVPTEKYLGKVSFMIPIRVDGSAHPGPRQLQISARYQACSETLCHPARTERMSVVLNVQRPR